MRCIDADALIKAIIRKEPFNDCARVVIAECMEEVRHAPTIEPERKKGKWVDCYTDGLRNMCKCSECGARIDIQEKFISFFCYHCGADMMEGGV